MNRLRERLWGYDFFVAYHWGSGGVYAVALAARLRERGYDVFLDRGDYAAGDDWKAVGEVALRHTQRLIVVATPAAVHESEPVRREVTIFRESGRQCIPILFGDDPSLFAALWPKSTLYESEDPEALAKGPSSAVIDKLVQSYRITRRRVLRGRITAAGMLALLGFSVFATISWVNAIRERAGKVEEMKGRLQEEQRHEDTRLIRGAEQALLDSDLAAARSLLDEVEDSRDEIEWHLVDSAQRLGSTPEWFGDETLLATNEERMLTFGSDRRLRVRGILAPTHAVVLPWSDTGEEVPYGLDWSLSFSTKIEPGLVTVGDRLWRLGETVTGPFQADAWSIRPGGAHVVRQAEGRLSLYEASKLDAAFELGKPIAEELFGSTLANGYWLPEGYLGGDGHSEVVWLGDDGHSYRIPADDLLLGDWLAQFRIPANNVERVPTSAGWLVELDSGELQIKDPQRGFANVRTFEVGARSPCLFLAGCIEHATGEGIWLRHMDGAIWSYPIQGDAREVFSSPAPGEYCDRKCDLSVFSADDDRPVIVFGDGRMQVGVGPEQEVFGVPDSGTNEVGWLERREHCDKSVQIERSDSGETMLFACKSPSRGIQIYGWTETAPERLAIRSEHLEVLGPAASLNKVEFAVPYAFGEVETSDGFRLVAWKWDQDELQFSPPLILAVSRQGWDKWTLTGQRLVLSHVAKPRTETYNLEKIETLSARNLIMNANFLTENRIAMALHPLGVFSSSTRTLKLGVCEVGVCAETETVGDVSSQADHFVATNSDTIVAMGFGGELTNLYRRDSASGWRHVCSVGDPYEHETFTDSPIWCRPNSSFSPNGKWLLVSGEDSQELWALDTLEIIKVFPGNEYSFLFTVDGNGLVRVKSDPSPGKRTLEYFRLPPSKDGPDRVTEISWGSWLSPSETWVSPNGDGMVTLLEKVSGGRGQPFYINLATGVPIPLWLDSSTDCDLNARWSEDGKLFAQLRARQGLFREIVVWNLEQPQDRPLVLPFPEGVLDFRLTATSIEILTSDVRIVHVEFGGSQTSSPCATPQMRQDYLSETADIAEKEAEICWFERELDHLLFGRQGPQQ